MVKVHKLVADAFIEKAEWLTDINHINGIKTDNRLINLERCTRSHNLKHAYDNKLRSAPFTGKTGAEHHLSKPVVQFDLLGNKIAEFPGQAEAFRITGIKQGDISAVCNGHQLTAGGYKWKTKQ